MNTLTAAFRASLDQVRTENAAAADEILEVINTHLPEVHDLRDGDNGYVDRSFGRRAITPMKRRTLRDVRDFYDLTAAINYVIVYDRLAFRSGFFIWMLLHNRDLIHYKTIGLWQP